LECQHIVTRLRTMGISADLILDGVPKKRFEKAKRHGSKTIIKVESAMGHPRVVPVELKRGSISQDLLASEQARLGRALLGPFRLVGENFDTLSYFASDS